MLELTPALIIICGIICFCAASIVGFSGFGFALISVPLLTLVMDMKIAVPLEVLLATFCVMILSANKLRFFKNPAVISIFIGMVGGSFVGVWLLGSQDTDVLKRALGVFVVLFAFHIYLRAMKGKGGEARTKEIPGGKRGTAIALLVGVLSGITGGLFGTSGPPLVVYIDHYAEDKSAFRAQLLVLFVMNDIMRVALYIWSGLLTLEITKFALWLLPAVGLGLFLGSRMHFQVSEKTFGKAIAAMLLFSGLLLTLRP